MDIKPLFLLVLCAGAWAAEPAAEATAELIRNEALRVSAGDSAAGRPLPLAGTWAPLAHNFSPEYQLELIRQGHHLLLCLGWPYMDNAWGTNRKMRMDNFRRYFEPALREAARLKLPISFYRFQFEMELTRDKRYFGLPPEQNPNVIGLDGKMQHLVDPLGPLEPWAQLGREEVTSECWQLVQELYPDPPLVILLSNNEHPVLNYHDAEKSQRFVARYGQGTPVAQRQQVFAEALVEHYRTLQESMRAGLGNEQWRRAARFVAYEAFGPRFLGRWGGWLGTGNFAPETGRMLWDHRGWDGGSPSYYTDNWAGFLTDHSSASVQVEALNWVFMLRQVHRENPAFWFELSTWDGDEYGTSGKRAQYLGRGGQFYDADRYLGGLQFGLWLLRPRALRDFRYLESREYAEPYYLANVKAVDQVYASPLLQRFWRHGELLPNPARLHPYGQALSEAVKQQERWFLLDTNLHSPARNWGLYTEIPVFALALVLGQAPQREWLVYAHAPRGARTGVKVTLPDFGEIVLDAPVTGSFYHVQESDRSVAAAIRGGPASARPNVAQARPAVGEPLAFTATDAYSPDGTAPALAWDFGDGTRASGPAVTHAFAKRGLYVVQLTAGGGAGNGATQALPVAVGYPQRADCLLFLPLERSPDRALVSERVQTGELKWFKEGICPVYAANTAAFCGLNMGCTWADDPERGQVLRLSGAGTFVDLQYFYDAESNRQIPRYDALGQNRTTCFWFKADEVKSRQMLYQDGSDNDNVMNLYLDDGRLYAGVASQARPDWAGTWLNVPVDAGRWHHVALVLDQADPKTLRDCLKLFVDGKLAATGPAYANRPYWPRIGGHWSTRFHDGSSVKKSVSLTGLVDDFAVFLRPLGASELQSLMALGREGKQQ